MKTNKAGRDLIQSWEGCKLTAYLCPKGKPTIGWGHTRDVKLGQKISQHQADVMFDSDLEIYEEGVANLTRGLKLNENQFAALVSFAYNFGVTRFASSTLLKKLRAGDFVRYDSKGNVMGGAAGEFAKWINVDGVPFAGLISRRAAECALFLRPA